MTLPNVPLLMARCTSAELPHRLRALVSQQRGRLSSEQLKRRVALGALAGTVLAIIVSAAGSDPPVPQAIFAWCTLGTLFVLLRALQGRKDQILFGILIGFFFFLWMSWARGHELLPSLSEARMLFDLRQAPEDNALGIGLSLLLVGSALGLDATLAPGRMRAPETPLFEYVCDVAAPLMADAALATPSIVRVPAQNLNDMNARQYQHDEMHYVEHARVLLSLEVPLEAREVFSMSISERVVGRTRKRRNARGRLKEKSKGHQRTIDVEFCWTLPEHAVAPPDGPADTSLAMQQWLSHHLSPGEYWGLRVSARQERGRLSARLRYRRSTAGPDFDRAQAPSPTLVHMSAQFLAQLRARALGQ